MSKREIEVILDTETTGLSPLEGHRLVEIGALEMVDKVLTEKKFHCYINPERDMPEVAYEIHGLSSDFLKDKPLFKDIADDFLSFIKGKKLVIHNAQFDVKFLNFELSKLSLPTIDLSGVIDTLAIARRKFPRSRVNLDALCRKFNIDNSSRELHGALVDANLLAHVYVELCGGRQSSFIIKNEKNKITKIETQKEELQYNYKCEGNGVIIEPTDIELGLHKKLINKIIN